jgi:serine/threonine protein kinase/tetratricopeptide (TPR) repeat protein
VPDEHWLRAKELFAEALDLAPDLREGFLAQRCPEDAALREEVRSLLLAHESAGGFIETPAGAVAAAQRDGWPTRFEKRMVGQYRLESEIGQGGMGTVYRAARADGTFEKQVAVKVIRRGLDTEDILLRFRHEREALASLDHPNIARLLDAGSTSDGLPYFVMEYVEGIPIDRFCDERRLTIAERLQVFRTVCAAVQAAHQNLVVHRDLKPDNILVTKDGVPKLVDFGIAKLLAPSAATAPQTRVTERLMTPGYASPEQVEGKPITTATDVYSLGVLLYELLTGRHPYRRADREGLEREIRERVPEKPSTVVTLPLEVTGPDAETRTRPATEVSQARQASPGALRRQLRGDLDIIVLMTMRKEPQRRYSSVEQLAEDVRRHLVGLPITARRDALGYRAARFVTRHAAAVAAGALLLAVLVAAVAVTAWEARVAAGQRDRARVEAAKTQQIDAFLQDMLRSPDPRNEGRNVRMVDALDRAAKRLEADKGRDPEVEAAIRRALGVTYGSLGLYDAAESHLRVALAALSGSSPAGRAEMAAVETELGEVLSSRGDRPQAEKLYTHALGVFDALGVGDDLHRADALNGLGEVLRARGDDVWAEARYREALGIRRRLLGDRDVAVAESLNNLAVVMHGRNDLAEAERLYRESLQIVRSARGDDHPGVPATLSNLATVVASRGDLAAAEPLYREALTIRRRVLGEDHPDLTFTMYAYADTLHALGRYPEAIALCRDVLARRGHSLPERHPVVAASLLVLGKSLLEQGDRRGAETALREALTIRRSILPPGHWQIASAQSALGRCLAKQGRFREAEPLLVEAFERLSADRGPKHERTRDALQNVVEMYDAWGKPDAAAKYRARQPS